MQVLQDSVFPSMAFSCMSDAKVADSSTCQRVGFEPANGDRSISRTAFTDTLLPGINVAQYHSVQKNRPNSAKTNGALALVPEFWMQLRRWWSPAKSPCCALRRFAWTPWQPGSLWLSQKVKVSFPSTYSTWQGLRGLLTPYNSIPEDSFLAKHAKKMGKHMDS